MIHPLRFLKRKTFRRGLVKSVHVFLVALLAFQTLGAPLAQAAEPIPVPTESAVAEAVPTPTPVANPILPQVCGLDIALTVDISGSIENEEMIKMKTALNGFTSSFVGTTTQMSLSSFNTDSILRQGFTSNLASIQAGITSLPIIGSENTNWDSGLARAQASFDPRPSKPNLIVIATDGSPNRTGYPSADPSFSWENGLNAAITRANAIKQTGTRIVVLAIGGDPTDPTYDGGNSAWNNPKLTAISGPSIATTVGAISPTTDVIKVSSFDGIGEAMATYASALCGGQLMVQKQIDTDGDGDVDLDGSVADQKLAGWSFSVENTTHVTPTSGLVSFALTNGTYALNEHSLPANSELVSMNCVKGQQPIGTFNPATRTISGLEMTSDATISCIVVNKLTTQVPPPGSLQVEKVVDQGNASPSAFGMMISPDPNGAGVQYPSLVGGHYRTTFTNLPAGTYTVTEIGVNGYHQVSSTCTNVAVASNQEAACVIHNTQDVVPYADLSVTKTDGLTTANPGQTLVYTMVVSNSGTATAFNTTATDTLPSYLSYISSQVDGVNVSPSVVGNVVTWSLGTIIAGGSKTIALTAKLQNTFPFGTTNVTNPVTVATSTQETTTANNSASDTDIVTATAQLGLQKTGPAQITAGDSYTYTLTWSVSGNASVTNAIITDPVPLNTTVQSTTCGTTTGTCTMASTPAQASWNLGTRNPGETGTVTVTVLSSSALGDGATLTNTASFDTTETDPVVSTAVTIVRAQTPGTPILSITKVNNVTTFINPGQKVVYTVTVTNAASATASANNVIMTDTLPTGLTYADSGLSTKTFALGTITPGNSVTVSYEAIVNATASSGTYTNVAVAKGDNTAQVSAQSTVQVRVPSVLGIESEPLLSITKGVTPNRVAAGSIVTYTVTVKNTGDADAINVVVTDTLPDGFTFVEDGTSTKIWNLGVLEASHTRVLHYDVRVGKEVPAGTYTNLAVVSADDQPDREAKANVTVTAPRVLGLAATGPGMRDTLLFLLGALAIAGGVLLTTRSLHGKRT